MAVPGLTNTVATGVNNNGDITGYGTGPNGVVSFLDIAGSFTFIAVPGASSTQANGLNDAQTVVGAYTDSAGSHGFVYSAGSYSTVDAPSPALPNTTKLTGINRNGLIVGTAAQSSGGITSTTGFVDQSGQFTFYKNFVIHGVNDIGDVVGISGAPGTPGEPTWEVVVCGNVCVGGGPTGFPGGTFTATNASAQVLLFYNGASYFQTDFNSTDLSVPISVPGASQTIALGMNNAGAIVGTYIDGSGQNHAFVAATAPPSCTVQGTGGSNRQLIFTIQDPSGLSQIKVTESEGATNVPAFSPGTTAPVQVTSQATLVALQATNTSNVSSTCASRMNPEPQWSGNGGQFISNLVAASMPGSLGPGTLEYFGIGTDGALWHSIGNSEWMSLGGASFAGDPVIIQDGGGQLELLAISTDGTLWNLSQNIPGQWSGTWRSIASGVKGRPAVVRNAAGQLQVFVRSSADDIQTLTQVSPGSAAWQGPTSLGGVVTSDPAVALDANGVAQVFAIGADQSLWNAGITTSGTVYPWAWLGGSLKGDPAVVSASGLLYVFGRATDDSAVYNSQSSSSSWNGWQSLGGVLVSNPTAAVNSDGRVEVFVVGSDQAVWHNAQAASGGAFSGWATLGGVIVGDIFPVVDKFSILNIFVVGGDYGMWGMAQTVPDYWF